MGLSEMGRLIGPNSPRPVFKSPSTYVRTTAREDLATATILGTDVLVGRVGLEVLAGISVVFAAPIDFREGNTRTWQGNEIGDRSRVRSVEGISSRLGWTHRSAI